MFTFLFYIAIYSFPHIIDLLLQELNKRQTTLRKMETGIVVSLALVGLEERFGINVCYFCRVGNKFRKQNFVEKQIGFVTQRVE